MPAQSAAMLRPEPTTPGSDSLLHPLLSHAADLVGPLATDLESLLRASDDVFMFSAVGAMSNALYLREAGDAADISAMDIHQGGIGDCYILSPIGELALFHPDLIRNMIHDNGNGTETVTLYKDARGGFASFASSKFAPVNITVNNSFASNGANNGANQDVVGNQKEIWVQVLEKAEAQLHGGYGAIANGGYPVLAMEELTGHKASFVSPKQVDLAFIQSHRDAGDLMVFDTPAKGGLPYGLVGSHAYMFDSLVGSGANAAVKLLNPWGFAEPAAIPISQLSKVFAEVDWVHV